MQALNIKIQVSFLYGRQKSTLPYYIGIQPGFVMSNTFQNKDFVNEGSKFSLGFSFEKLLGYRPSLIFNFRAFGNYRSSTLNYNADNFNGNNFLTTSQLKKSLDMNINFSYLFLDFRGWQYRAAAGIGFVGNSIEVSDTSTRQINNTNGVIPFQLSTGRILWKRLELEIGYRYYIGLNDKVNGVAFRTDYDKYSFAFIGVKYLLGKKDYRFQKKGTCPTVE